MKQENCVGMMHRYEVKPFIRMKKKHQQQAIINFQRDINLQGMLARKEKCVTSGHYKTELPLPILMLASTIKKLS